MAFVVTSRHALIGCALTALFGLLALVGCAPQQLDAPPAVFPEESTSLSEGKALFWAGGCAACHASPESGTGGDLLLGGGMELNTRYGTFRVPNISSDKVDGIGAWTDANFANAMLRGVAPSGEHYFPAFPYTSYARMSRRDVMNLWAYLKTLPAVSGRAEGHDLRFPFNNRRAVGIWKRMYFRPHKIAELSEPPPLIARGQYLVEGPGHCGECHTPRTALGGPDHTRWLGGGTSVDGQGFVPNITSGSPFIAAQTAEDIALSLKPAETHAQSGEYGFEMEAVRRNLAELPARDRLAIAAYLKAIPAISDPD